MTQPVSFGRRGQTPRKVPQAQSAVAEIALTPEQRAYLLGADAAAPDDDLSRVKKPSSRGAGLIACLSVTALVAALTLLGKPHDTVAALPPQLEAQGKAAFHLAGDWFTPLTLAWSIFVISSNLGANLWLTEKVCRWSRWSGLSAFALIGATTSVVFAFVTALIGLGETEIGYVLEAVSGGGAAALYRLLAGRRAFQ